LELLLLQLLLLELLLLQLQLLLLLCKVERLRRHGRKRLAERSAHLVLLMVMVLLLLLLLLLLLQSSGSELREGRKRRLRKRIPGLAGKLCVLRGGVSDGGNRIGNTNGQRVCRGQWTKQRGKGESSASRWPTESAV
jgi:hypothetical protein